jgi:hypothetical protein
MRDRGYRSKVAEKITTLDSIASAVFRREWSMLHAASLAASARNDKPAD